jgi:transposase InsO family protein
MIVSDNGTEFTSNAMLAWAEEHNISWHFIAPGKPMHNGFCESFAATSSSKNSILASQFGASVKCQFLVVPPQMGGATIRLPTM